MATQWNFGEIFVNQMQERRRLDQQRDQYIQDMAYKNRQQSFNQMYQQAQIKNMNLDNERQQQILDMTKQKSEYEISKDYTPVMGTNEDPRQYKRYPGAVSGKDVNKSFNGMLSPLEEDKMYVPKGEKSTPIDLYEDSPQVMGTGKNAGKPVVIRRNKVTNEEKEIPVYQKPEKQSSSGGGGKKTQLDSEYEVNAFNRLRGATTKSAFGLELEAQTPQQKDADYNIVMNSLLTNTAMEFVQGLRKGIGEFPTNEEIIIAMEKNPKLSDEDFNSIENFLSINSQLETFTAPTKKEWYKK